MTNFIWGTEVITNTNTIFKFCFLNPRTASVFDRAVTGESGNLIPSACSVTHKGDLLLQITFPPEAFFSYEIKGLS